MGRRDKGPGGEGRGPGEGAAGRAVSAQDCFLNGHPADLPGQRNGVTEMPQSSRCIWRDARG